MRVEVGWNFGISKESLMRNSVLCRLFSCCFFSMEWRIMILSFKRYRCHRKVIITFLKFQNIRTDNFNLAKSLRNICKEVIFLQKNELLQSYFSKYCSLYFKDIAFFWQLKEHILLAVASCTLSNFSFNFSLP